MKFRFITLSDPYYQDARMLRWEVLSKPLGIPPEGETSVEEKKSIQLIALEKNHILGCVLCCPLSEDEGKVFDFALSEEGKGLGRQLMHKLESYMQDRGLSHLHVLAQKGEEAFFRSLGYSTEGDPFEEYGVSYQKMGKKLLLSA